MPSGWQMQFESAQWQGPSPGPFRAIHMCHLRTGKILMWGFGESGGTAATYRTPEARLWTPPSLDAPPGVVGTFQSVPNDRTNLLCAGHSFLSDGRLFCAGGHFFITPVPDPIPPGERYVATKHTDIFDPIAEQWLPGPDMAYERWYPTCTTLASRQVLITLGELYRETNFTAQATIPEIRDPASGLIAQLPEEASINHPPYPFIFQVPGGRICYTGGDPQTKFLPASLQGPWQALPENTYHPDRYYASAVMFRPGKIMKIGGSLHGQPGEDTHKTSVFDSATNAWTAGPSMIEPRINHNAVILPGETILVVGGERWDVARDPPELVRLRNAEFLRPGAVAWEPAPDGMADPRPYHSTLILLKDARVVCAGSNEFATAQIFRPWYFDLDQDTRPVIASAPSQIAVPPPGGPPGAAFRVTWHPQGDVARRAISKVCLIALGAVTHGFDQNQRYVPLTFEIVDEESLDILPPLDTSHAPSGWYMFFLVTEDGLPSVAVYIQVV